MNDIKVFALNSFDGFGEQVVASIRERAVDLPIDATSARLRNLSLSNHDERYFHDDEAFCASLENVRGCDCFVVGSCYSDNEESVNDKIIKMLIFIGSLRDASAAKVTAVMPYFPYARQDRKTASRAPITTKYLARWLESVSADRILCIDAHNPTAIQNAFKVNVDLLEANGLFAKYLSNELKAGTYGIKLTKNSIVVMSPDAGGMSRARKFRSILERYLGEDVGLACMDKIHNDTEIRGNGIIGKVKERFIVILDDMISSGKTIKECVDAARTHGAYSVLAVCATHGLFVGKSNEFLDDPFLQRIVITDTINPFRLTNTNVTSKLVVINTAELFGEAIRRTYMSESISDLIEKNGVNIKLN